MNATSPSRLLSAALALWISATAVLAGPEPFAASEHARHLDPDINWDAVSLITVQDGGRYKTLDSFAREMMTSMYGRESLPGLSPLASLCDWLFRRQAYVDTPVVRIKDKGLRIHFSAHMPEAARTRIVSSSYMTPRELADPTVRARMKELETRTLMSRAVNRAREAQFVAEALERLVNIVPAPGAEPIDPWFTPDRAQANLSDAMLAAGGTTREELISRFGDPVPGLSPETAAAVVGPWAQVRLGWLSGDAAKVQAGLDALAGVLPKIAPEVYPSESQRMAEARYYAMGKFTWGWVFYFLGMLVAIWALVTNWRVPWGLGMILLVAAMAIHAAGIALRWYILGRIPVANMFEAVVGSAWIGCMIAFVGELLYRRRFFLVGAHATGFLALILGQFVIPGGGTLTTIMGILDDVMLRIHTVLIIASYALIFLAAVIAIVYLYGYYLHRAATRSAVTGLVLALAGFFTLAATTLSAEPRLAQTMIGVGLAGMVVLVASRWLSGAARDTALAVGGIAVIGGLVAGTAPAGFATGTGGTLVVTGLVWALLTGAGIIQQRLARPSTEPALAVAGGAPAALRASRPVMAGGAPGDESQASSLPVWLQHCDWCHLIILNLVFIMLFVGIILGAVWADYSWGRPWGWDPKEVFALNTWIIYAILIHLRFITKNRGLWTAWLSVAGCLMMAFNWCFVNFFIVGLHSYA